MIPAFSPFLALRYLMTRRINLLCIGGVMFAVWAMLLVDSVFTGFVTKIRTAVRGSAPELLLSDLPHDVSYDRLRPVLEAQTDLVVATAPRLRHHGVLQSARPLRRRSGATSSTVDFDPTQQGFALLLGIDPDAEVQVSGLRTWIERGPDPFRRHGNDSVKPSTVLEEPDAERRRHLLLPDAEEWRLRRTLGLPVDPDPQQHRSQWPGVLFGTYRMNDQGAPPGTPFDLTVAGFSGAEPGQSRLHTDSVRVVMVGCFLTGHDIFDTGTVLLPIETLRTLLGHDEGDPDSLALVTDIAIAVPPGLSPQAIADGKRRLAALVQPLLPAGSKPCSVLDWEEQNQVFLSAVAHEQGMMQFVLFVVMLVAAFVIYATLHMLVTQKIKDIGILAAIGGSPAGIRAVFLFGGLVVAGIGTVLGIAIGVLSAHNLNAVDRWAYENFGLSLFPPGMFDLSEIPSRVDPGWIATVGIGAMALALFVAWLPAQQAARLHPVLALSHE